MNVSGFASSAAADRHLARRGSAGAARPRRPPRRWGGSRRTSGPGCRDRPPASSKGLLLLVFLVLFLVRLALLDDLGLGCPPPRRPPRSPPRAPPPPPPP